jgi:glycosyltransferase involved in cell wall biosynthesis
VQAALLSLLEDRPRLRAMGEAAARRVREGFLWEAVLPRYLALLDAATPAPVGAS